MAKLRPVLTNFYEKPDVIDVFTPDERLFFICCMTNPRTTQSGIYTISRKHFVQYTGFNDDTIKSLLKRFQNEYNEIMYDETTGVIAIKRWFEWNPVSNINIAKGVVNEFNCIIDKTLIDFVTQSFNDNDLEKIYSAMGQPITIDARFKNWRGYFTKTYKELHQHTISTWYKESYNLHNLLQKSCDEELIKQTIVFKKRIEKPTNNFMIDAKFLPSVVDLLWDKLRELK